MQTRRAFIKTLLGFGALLLPWSVLPESWKAASRNLLSAPPIKLSLPPEPEPEPEIGSGIPPEVLNRTALDDIAALSAPEMQGRKAGTLGEIVAADYLVAQLEALGLEPGGDGGNSFKHVFTIPPVTEIIVNGRLTFKPGGINNLRIPGFNVLGVLEGKNPEEVILLSAHYDHLGIYQGRLYPGANDNASGVGCILSVLRRILREGIAPERTVVLAFWSAEEMGLFGSQAFVASPTFPLSQIRAVVNADTVGNGNTGDFILWAGNENLAYSALRAAASEVGATATRAANAGHNSDSASFANVGIPAVTILTRAWLERNHSPEDNIGLLKPEQLQLAEEIVYRTVQRLAF